jgi:hypothetical protein
MITEKAAYHGIRFKIFVGVYLAVRTESGIIIFGIGSTDCRETRRVLVAGAASQYHHGNRNAKQPHKGHGGT